MSGGGFDAGSITSTLGLDISPFAQGMLQSNAIAALFPATVQHFLASPLLGVISLAEKAAGAIKSAFLEVGHAADNAGEAAEKAGVSVQFLTGVGALAKDAGSSVEGLADSLKFLNNNSADAAAGNATTIKNFKDIGVVVTDAAGKLKPTEQLFYEVADAIASLPTPAQKTQAAMNLLGRGGTDMIAALNKGSGGIKDFQRLIEGLGGTIDQDLADAGDKFGTLETVIGAAWAGVKKTVAQPILQFVADHFEEIVAAISNAAGQIRAAVGSIMPGIMQLLPSLGHLASSVVDVVVPAFQLLGKVLDVVAKPLSFILDLISKVLSGIGSVASSVIGFFGGGGTSTPAAEAAAAGGGKAGTSVNIEQINVAAPDVNEATTQIAAKLQRPMQDGINKQRQQLDAAAKAGFALRSL